MAMDRADTNSKLFELIEARDTQAFIAHVEETRADTEERNMYGETPLFRASKTGLHGVVEYLVDKGANLESRDHGNFTPLHSAAIYGHFRCAKILLDAGANAETRDDAYNSCPLISAVFWGFTNIVQLLCMRGEPVSAMTAKYGYGPLIIAALKGFTKVADILLKHNANVEERASNGTTPLIAASSQGSLPMVKLLLNHGASVHIRNNNGETPLYCACSFGDCSVVTFLLQNGSQLQKENLAGDTPLHVACTRGHVDVAEVLLKFGADPNRKGYLSRTPLHCAALRKNTQLMKLIIDFSANIDHVDSEGKTALDLLGNQGTVDISGHHLLETPQTSQTRRDRLPPINPKQIKSVTYIDSTFLQTEMTNSVSTINQFMRLCKRQFPLTKGFEDIAFKTEIFPPQPPGFIQILSKDKNQSKWVLLSTTDFAGAVIRVYDPLMKESHSHELKCKIASQIRYTNLDTGHLIVQVMNVQQALCHRDTGPLVMAFATDILHGRDPATANYGSGFTLRKHITECLRKKQLTQFPRTSDATRRHVRQPELSGRLSAFGTLFSDHDANIIATMRRHVPANSIKAWYKMELHCICHMPYDREMTTCSTCQRFFHPSCLFGNINIIENSEGTPHLLCLECSPLNPHHLAPIPPPNLNNPNLQYDVFVSYSYADFKFVRSTFMRVLDRRDGNGIYDLMVCDRDFLIGGPIVDTIVEKMEQSVKAVAIISKSFLRGEYTNYEWQMMVKCKPYASAVILLDPPDSLEMSSYLRTLLASRMYLEWSDDPVRQARFWQKLKRFLGTPLHQLRHQMATQDQSAKSLEAHTNISTPSGQSDAALYNLQ